MVATWFFLWLGNLLLAIGYLTLNLVVYKIGLIATVPLTISIILLIGGPGAALAYASGIVWFLPGTDHFLIAIGALF